jgi:hypothetical protein
MKMSAWGRLTAACLVLLATCAQAEWRDEKGKVLPQRDDAKYQDTFLVQLVVTSKVEEFRTSFKSGKFTQVESTSQAKVGEPLTGMVFVSNCKPGADKKCKVTAKVQLEQPDGKRLDVGNIVVWDQAAPLQDAVVPGMKDVSIAFDKTDATGKYKLRAKVTDEVAGITLDLVAPIKLKKS